MRLSVKYCVRLSVKYCVELLLTPREEERNSANASIGVDVRIQWFNAYGFQLAHLEAISSLKLEPVKHAEVSLWNILGRFVQVT